jgi:hypothetical protein
LLVWVNRPITSAAVNVLNSAMVEPKYAEGLMRGRWKCGISLRTVPGGWVPRRIQVPSHSHQGAVEARAFRTSLL